MVGGAEGAGERLVVIEENPMVPDIGQIAGIEQELSAEFQSYSPCDRVGEVDVRGEAPRFSWEPVQFQTVDLPPGIVECGENQRLAKQTVVELVLGALCNIRPRPTWNPAASFWLIPASR